MADLYGLGERVATSLALCLLYIHTLYYKIRPKYQARSDNRGPSSKQSEKEKCEHCVSDTPLDNSQLDF